LSNFASFTLSEADALPEFFCTLVKVMLLLMIELDELPSDPNCSDYAAGWLTAFKMFSMVDFFLTRGLYSACISSWF